ncbi:MAG: NADP-dependent oxidoreductase, partial [Gemmatimonadota bacterium]|nr:NADP-dependent oxidoreductase [Gemmatimonadota bacterium]
RLTFRGFIVSYYADQREEAFSTLGGWIREDKLRYKEDIVDGLENAPAALIGLLKGENFGKLIIRMSDDPTK